MKLTQESIIAFQKFIWQFYATYGRQFPWRNVQSPYAVLVSEIMLQQTQTYRVEPKYEQWLLAFPSCEMLAAANLRDVLTAWQGLGYNRRGMAIHKIAQIVMQEYQGQLPVDPTILETFPGIGKATAASICAFAFNMPTVFVETNIRAVFIHSFFKDKAAVDDKELLPLVAQTVDAQNPREWYYALMDYGVHLKKLHANPARRSAHHTKQSRFEGSDRQIRGAVVRALTEHPSLKMAEIIGTIQKEPDRVKKIIKQLCAEGLIHKKGPSFFIP